jgi:hypothetical protein
LKLEEQAITVQKTGNEGNFYVCVAPFSSPLVDAHVANRFNLFHDFVVSSIDNVASGVFFMLELIAYCILHMPGLGEAGAWEVWSQAEGFSNRRNVLNWSWSKRRNHMKELPGFKRKPSS